MEAVVVLVTLACYGLAGFLTWRYQTPLFVFILLSGHIGALGSPLWSYLYNVFYQSDLVVMTTLLDVPLFRMVFIASAWFYTLPSMIVFALYRAHWWFPNYLSVVLTYAVFLFYHLIIETLGLRLSLWYYATTVELPFGFSHALISAVMAALISLALLHVLLIVYRFSWSSMLLVLLPTTLVLSLLVHGVLGAPLWIAQLLTVQSWATLIGLVTTLALLLWAGHIVARGLEQVYQRQTP
ncbi:MAG: hypothetical protein ACLFVO_29945 [Chloroflexaceae bacterium]